tara:strand:+ start:180 stop:434 length:255 start_codon:yes stop_codon:yes gene_type:complete
MGAAFIKRRLKEKPGSRIFIHCKGGIARASCMTLSHFILNENVVTDAGVASVLLDMKAKRPVVYEGTGEFWSIRRLLEEESYKK